VKESVGATPAHCQKRARACVLLPHPTRSVTTHVARTTHHPKHQKQKDEAVASDAFWLAALAAGCVAGSASLWYYSRRYVGELALLTLPPPPPAGTPPAGTSVESLRGRPARAVRLSVLDFWGNREVCVGWLC
jgi:hypothetical protein